MIRKLVLLWASLIVVAALLVGLSGCSDTTGAQPINLTGNQQGIWVSGEGKVEVTPNIANLSLGVTVQAATVAQAQSQATTAMSAVMSVLTSNGIAAKDIQTENFSIQQIRACILEADSIKVSYCKVKKSIILLGENMEFAQLSNRYFFYNTSVETSNESARVTSISDKGDASTANDLHRRLKSKKNLHIETKIHSLATI
jgi:hypothetical protein